MMKRLFVATCFALGLSACGADLSEEALENEPVERMQQQIEPPVYVCGLDDCPEGMCVTGTIQSSTCSGGRTYVCTRITQTTMCY